MFIDWDNIAIIKDLIGKEIEVCGIIKKNKDEDTILYCDSVSDAIPLGGDCKHELIDQKKGSKSSCRQTKHDDFVWHTHPYTSKAYPSMTDIKKMERKKVSLIFTKWGAWAMQRKGQYPRIKEEQVRKINNKLYKNTIGGHEFNKDSVKKYLKDINDVLNPGVYIKFVSWQTMKKDDLVMEDPENSRQFS